MGRGGWEGDTLTIKTEAPAEDKPEKHLLESSSQSIFRVHKRPRIKTRGHRQHHIQGVPRVWIGEPQQQRQWESYPVSFLYHGSRHSHALTVGRAST